MNEDFLDIEITVETLAAYPSSTIYNFLFHVSTGELVQPEDVFLQEQMEPLVKFCNRELQNRIPTNLDGEYKFTRENLNQFGIRRLGIMFHYDFQFPHTCESLEPNDEMYFSWDDMTHIHHHNSVN